MSVGAPPMGIPNRVCPSRIWDAPASTSPTSRCTWRTSSASSPRPAYAPQGNQGRPNFVR
jgi:hypothetical protein